jgi:nucleotide-binding universal stress UspA family protein
VFAKLLVPLDGTPESAAALPLAHALGKATGAAITLVTVVHGDGPTEPARRYLGAVAAELAAADSHRVETAVRRGEAAFELLAEARAAGADLIVMATHGRGGPARAILGSVAQDVLAASRVPVALVRPGGRRVSQLGALLVPIDGTPGATLALGTAVGLARASGARLVLLRVTWPMPPHLEEVFPEGTLGTYVDPAWIEEEHAAAEQYVARLAERLRSGGLGAEGRCVAGRPGETIVQTAADVGADLIVMSTHALTGPERALLGSVADEVVRAADRPVVLVRRRGGRLPAAPEEVRR